MEPFAAHQIRGTYATLLLPIQRDDSIDYDLLAEDLDTILRCSVHGVYTHGTAGEFFTLSEDEFDRINALLAERCEAARVPFQIGAAFPTPPIALSRVKRAAALRPSAIQITLPDWWPPSFEECVSYVLRCSEAADGVSLVLYNPPHAKRLLAPAELLQLCEQIPTLAGFKLGGGDAAWYAAMQPVFARASVFIPGHSLATGIASGAAGSYSNLACLTPRGSVRWNNLIHDDLPRALLLEKDIQRFMTEQVLPFRAAHGRSNMALDKLLASVGGWSSAGLRLRWPYLGISEEEALPLRRIARDQISFLFEE